MVGHDRPDRVALAVVRLLAQQHEVGRLLLQHLPERVPGGADVRVLERRVGQVDGPVSAERHGLVERAHRALGSHSHRDDLLDVRGAPLLDLHGGLDGVRVERVQVLLAAPIEALRALVHVLVHGGVWDLFHEDANLQGISFGRCAAGILLARLRS